jgi:hypothetical protein
MANRVRVGTTSNECFPLSNSISLAIIKFWIIEVDTRIKNCNSQRFRRSLLVIVVIVVIFIKVQYLEQVNKVVEPPIAAALPRLLSASLLSGC